MQKNTIENISKIIARLPGMGPRIAKRITLHLISNKEKILQPLIQQLQSLNDNVHQCKICGNFDEGEVCVICANKTRDDSIICVVEEVADLWAIERSGNYRGKYHVLGGNLSAISGKTAEDLNFKSLYSRIDEKKSSENPVKEVIIATSATIDGQTTAHFLAEQLKEFSAKVTHLAYGIPMGSELDYLDEGTISIAFKTRAEF